MFTRVSRGARAWSLVAAAAGSVGLLSAADAAMLLQMDLNSIVVNAGSTFDGETHTGVLTLSADADASLTDVLIDGASQDFGDGLAALSGEIRLSQGVVLGGYVRVTTADGAVYAASIMPAFGDVSPQPGQGFSIDGLTGLGLFSNLPGETRFAGVDVSPFLGGRGGAIDGSFFLFGFGPNAQGQDTDADLELYLVIPAPGSVALAGVGAALGLRRRSRA